MPLAAPPAPPPAPAQEPFDVLSSSMLDEPELPPVVEIEAEADVTAPWSLSEGDAEGMVRIAARRLRSAYGGGEVEVAEFLLDRAPVSNQEYAAFLDATGASPPAHWMGGRPPANKLGHPVVGVSLEEARQYAAWRGKRLPTSAEWECAARGPDGTAFPWGDAFEPDRCRCPEGGAEGTSPVDEYPLGATLEGCIDLVGNVWEWTERDERLPAPDEGFAWVFGGSFRHPCGRDGRIARSSVAMANSYEYLGFRCAGAGGR
jgi:formylglycine-generating enzyme required for sulfatase activity